MRLFSILGLALLGLALHVPAHATGKVLVVGVHPYQPTRALIAYHEHLAAHLRATLKRPVRIVTAKSVRAFGSRILAGEYELVLGPGHLLRLAQRERGWHPLARYVPDTPLLLLARSDAGDLTVDALKGRTLASPGRVRLAGRAAETWLAERQLLPGRDFEVLDAGTPASAIHALVSGKADMAVATLASMSQARSDEVAQLRIVEELAPVPLLFFAARPDVSPAMRARLQRALLAYATPQGIRPVVATEQELAAMDVYLDQTRQLLQGQPDAEPERRASQ